MTSDRKREVTYHIINSVLAGALVFLGSFVAGRITWYSVAMAAVASTVVAISKFKVYWDTQEDEYSKKGKRNKPKEPGMGGVIVNTFSFV